MSLADLLSYLTPEELTLVDGLLNDSLLWMPSPENIPQQMAYTSQADILYYGGAAGGGKSLGIGAKVITPWGFKVIGDLVVGDTICNPDGTHQKVIGVYPQGVQDLYKVTFQDGPNVLATGDHLWLYTAGKGKADRKYLHEEEPYPYLKPGQDTGYRIATTQMLVDKFETNQRFHPRVPLTEPIKFTMPYNSQIIVEQLDSYVLGLLLGDGSLSGPGVIFTSSDTELIEEVKTRTLGDWVQYDSSKFGWHARGTTRTYLNAILSSLGLKGTLSDTKFIPKPFLLLVRMASVLIVLRALDWLNTYAG
jgi:phosphate starvation-inducible PhoH-like protein